MATRPLRQHYATDGAPPLPVSVDPELASIVPPWRRHRTRFLDELAALDPADWDHPTRCADWSVREVVGHLVVVDGFWPLSLHAARDGAVPTTYLTGFDPSSSTDEMVAATTATPVADLYAQHRAGTDALVTLVESFGASEWDGRCESPLGHLPARFILAHAYWDSWLHEYDILITLDRAPVIDPDDLLAATWFSLWFAGVQGGLADDPYAVGPGPDTPIEACLAFSDLPGRPLHLSVGTLADGVSVAPCASDHAPLAAGRAVDAVEGLTGRQPTAAATGHLPPDVAAQVRRAALVF